MYTVRQPLLLHHLFCQTAHLRKIEEDGTQVGIASKDFNGVRSRAASQVKEACKGREINATCQGMPEATRAGVLSGGKGFSVLCIISEIVIWMGDLVYR